MRYLKAKVRVGGEHISQFSRLANVQAYVVAVFAGTKPFNLWRLVADRHPLSGEKVAIRQRVMISGRLLASIEEVKPKTGMEEQAVHNFNPENFEPVLTVSRGSRGTFRVPSNRVIEVEGFGALPPNTVFPKHRNPSDYRDYVIVVAGDENGEGEVRYYTDGRGSSLTSPAPVRTSFDDDGDGDGDDDGLYDDDDDSDDGF